MSSQEVLAEEVEVKNPTPQDAWAEHVRKAVRKFLKTAVVVDNDPGLSGVRDAQPQVAAVEQAGDSGMDDNSYVLEEPENALPVSGESRKVLDIRKISDTFSYHGMACAFVLPEDSDENEQAIKERVVRAAKTADILVLDWQLRPRSSRLTLELLREIAESDYSENGRMRLICIYTGEALDDHIFNQARDQLTVHGVVFEQAPGIEGFPYIAKSKSSLVVLANKDEIDAELLPVRLIDLFAELANGLIPAFALAAVGAVRKNTHHMLTRFSGGLDSAYVANRLITDPPGDVAELMRELLVAECDNAIGLDSVADDYLEPDVISMWLNLREVRPIQAGEQLTIDRVSINGMLANGVSESGFRLLDGNQKPFPEKHRHKVTQSLVRTDAEAYSSENEFSRLAAFRREAFGGSTAVLSDSWRPSLTTGTLLKQTGADGVSKYFLCFTPACDAIRINKERPFVFMEGRESSKPYSLVVKGQDGRSVGLYFDKTYPQVATFTFLSDDTQRVRAHKIEDGGGSTFIFRSVGAGAGAGAGTDSIEFIWLGEMRYGRAMSEMASLASRWMRVGILDSEYLRLAGRKHFNFSA